MISSKYVPSRSCFDEQPLSKVNMSWLGNQTILLVFSVLWALVTSDIYKSVMWTTNNPLFSDSGKESRCFGEDLEMRVHLQSSLPIVCPFDFIIMKTLASKPATGVLYENFWIVYDEPSFRNCDVNMTAEIDGEKNKKLLICDSPEALKSFTYSIDFKAKTPANSGLSFVGGRYYYFLTTSDGTDGSLNNTRGGHCNDPAVRMKFKIYICRTDDKKCQNVPIGEFLCPSDLLEASTTTSSPPTVPFEPSTQITTDSPGDTTSSAGAAGESSSGNTGTPFSSTTTTDNSNVSPAITPFYSTPPITTSKTFPSGTDSLKPKAERKEVLNEFSRWKTLSIASSCLFVALLIANIIVCYITRRKQKHCLCLIDIPVNKVTPPETGPQTPEDYYHDKQSNMCEDSEDGKAHHHMMVYNKPTEDNLDKQTQEQNGTQEPGNPQPAWSINSAKCGNGTPCRRDGGEKN